MNSNTKLAAISKLDEKQLREQVLVPLLNRMGHKAVTLYHGPRERGKDIIALDYDRLERREYLAVVAKASDLNGSVSSSNSLREVLHQIEQCFDIPYEDLFGMTRITMDRVWVVTSGRIVPGAEDSIFSTLEKRNLSKLVRFISGENLTALIDQHFQSYWEDSFEPIENLREQKNRLSVFVKKLLVTLGAEPTDAESTISKVIHSSFPPSISSVPDRTLTRVSPYGVEVDTISSKYAHDFYSDQCGFIKGVHFKAKESLYHAMFEVEEVIEHYEEVVAKTDPREFVSSFSAKLSQDHPFWNARFGRASEALSDIQDLEYGLNDIDDLLERLDKAGKLDWATALVDSVGKLENAIEVFLSEVDKDDFSLTWQIETFGEIAKLVMVHDSASSSSWPTFNTRHRNEVEVYRYRQKKTRRISVQDITESVQIEIREHLEVLLSKSGFPREC